MPDFYTLLIPSFIAGVLTFLAPCTLPLVPAFLGFISGTSYTHTKNTDDGVTRKVVWNAFLYVIGFSIIFIFFGVLFGIAGSALVSYRLWLNRLGGVFIIFFGLYLVHAFENKYFSFLYTEKKLSLTHTLTPGKPVSSLLFGMTFALGWTPCVGPILGSVLLLASTTQTVLYGAVLLAVFSFGLGLPFVLIALFWGRATEYIAHLQKYLHVISIIGGVFLILLGVLIATDHMALFTRWFYDIFNFLQFEQQLQNYF